MYKIISFFVISVFILYPALAQSSIKGKVTDSETNPLEYVTVALYSLPDSALQYGATTGSNGYFLLEQVSPGKYYLVFSMVGFVKAFSEPVNVQGTKVYTIKDMVLYEDVLSLKEVTVSATRNFVEQQADKMVINPEASITTASDDVLEVLRKSPGILIDKDNNITLKNKQVKVMIDGRSTYMSGEQLAALLRNMQATSIDRIEIIENPSSRYDAEGDAGIINIRTKKGLMKGYNGSITVGANINERFSNNYGIDLNYRGEKWNIYGNYYGGQQRGWSDFDMKRYYMSSDSSLFDQNSHMEWNSYYNNMKLGADYYITPRQVVGVMARGNIGTGDEGGDGSAYFENYAGERLQDVYTSSRDNRDFKNILVNLNYKWTIDTLGQELSFDADMGRYKSDTEGTVSTEYVPYTHPLIIRKGQGNTSNFYSVKADYVLPYSPKLRIEAGLKASWARIDSDLDYKEKDEFDNWGDPRRMSNKFKYSENINAAYASGNYKFSDKTSLQLGLRGEQTIVDGYNETSDQKDDRTYLNLFPSIFFQQKIKENHQLGFSYSYRIGRPPYWMLNPFMWIIDPYTYSRGNPDLDPQFTHATKASYTFKNKYILSVSYNYTKDAWMQMIEQDDETHVSTIARDNLDNFSNASVTMVLPFQITKWWNTNTNLTCFYSEYNSEYRGGDMNNSQVSFQGNTTFTFLLPKDISFELSGRYISKIAYGMIEMREEGSVNIGIQKQFFDKKLSLKINANDIFGTQRALYTSQYQNINLKGLETYGSRRIGVTLIWRFGRNDIKAARQRSTGLDEESSRVGK